MVTVKLGSRRAIMRVRLVDRLQAGDFRDTVMPAAERLRAQHGRIAFLILDVRRFGGWGAVGAFAAQIRFLRHFGRDVVHVAVLGPGAWGGAIPAIAALFVSAEVRSFTPAQGAQLREWIRRG
jgi:hypothetical protein